MCVCVCKFILYFLYMYSAVVIYHGIAKCTNCGKIYFKIKNKTKKEVSLVTLHLKLYLNNKDYFHALKINKIYARRIALILKLF